MSDDTASLDALWRACAEAGGGDTPAARSFWADQAQQLLDSGVSPAVGGRVLAAAVATARRGYHLLVDGFQQLDIIARLQLDAAEARAPLTPQVRALVHSDAALARQLAALAEMGHAGAVVDPPRLEESEARLDQALQRLRQRLQEIDLRTDGERPATTSEPAALAREALALERDGAVGAAEARYRQLLTVIEAGHASPDLAVVGLGNLGELLRTQGRAREALPYLQAALEHAQAAFGAQHRRTATAHNNLALSLQATGEFGAAEAHFQHALAGWRAHLGATHPRTATGLHNLGDLLRIQGRYPDAEPLLREAADIWQRTAGLAPQTLATGLYHLALLYRGTGRTAEAQRLMGRVEALLGRSVEE